MNTTSLFVELVVIGAGAAVWLLLAVLSVFGYAWFDYQSFVTLPVVFMALPLVYVLGIVVDRFADFAFQGWDKKLRAKHFRQSDDYQRARTVIYDRAESLREWFHYSRSRLRICRGWAINALLCIIGMNTFVWLQWHDGPKLAITLFANISLGLLAIGLCRAWQRLTDSEYNRLREEYACARDEQL